MSVTSRERDERAVRRRWRWIAGVVVAALVVAGAWAGYVVWQVQRDLTAARTAATGLPAALATAGGADRVVDELETRAASAVDLTSGATWSALEALPALGDDFDAAARASRAVDIVARDAARPLAASGLSAETFAPRDGRLPVQSIAKSADPLTRAAAGVAAARDELAPVELGGLTRELRPGFEQLLEELDEATRTLDGAALAAGLLPGMLGVEGERDYLVVFQNNAEPRSLGGMPGLMAPLRADRGAVALGETVAAGSFGRLDKPVLPLTAEERRIWFEQPGTWFQDAVFIPDFPRASELMAARWSMETGGEVDGVLSVDPVALSHVLRATGPITVDGVRLTSTNFVDEVLHQPYLRYQDDPAAENAFFSAIMTSMFEKVLGSPGDPAALMGALARGASEGRLLAHSFDDNEQARLSGTRVAGELADTAGGPAQAAVFVNDATGSKMGYFLDYDARIGSVSCAGDVIGFNGTLRIHSRAPADASSLPATVTGPGTYGVARGDHLNVFDLVAPVGGEITEVTVNGARSRGTNRTFRGRPVVSVPILLTPGDVVTLTWRATSGPEHESGVELVSTPGVHHGGAKVFVPAPCAGSAG